MPSPLPQQSLIPYPEHVAIIMDGNGRWAAEKGNSRAYGHENGRESVREAVQASIRYGVKYLTLYAFSTENWKRPAEEVETLMKILRFSIEEFLPEMLSQKIRLHTIGDLSRLPQDLRHRIAQVKQQTDELTDPKLTLILALNYGSQQEITRAMKHVAEKVKNAELSPEEITEEIIASHLETRGIPDPELLIRTSGEQRLSNFLLWQLAYTEFIFTPVYWPDFKEADFAKALEEYTQRNRRFGGL